ncbi:hypothetical protein [Nonomuraea recticatena]
MADQRHQPDGGPLVGLGLRCGLRRDAWRPRRGRRDARDGGATRSGGTDEERSGGGVSSALITYLEQNQGTVTWLVAVGSARQAAPIILETGEPVIAMGGFTGRDPALTVQGLKELVASGRLKYVMADDARGGPGRGDSEVTDWVRATCAAVDGQDGLYHCAP